MSVCSSAGFAIDAPAGRATQRQLRCKQADSLTITTITGMKSQRIVSTASNEQAHTRAHLATLCLRHLRLSIPAPLALQEGREEGQ